MLSAGNDSQFRILCSEAVFGTSHWLEDERFTTNSHRVKNREEMVGLIEEVLAEKTTAEWCEKLTGKGYAALVFSSRALS
jgi:succinate--hydroxymethylglutarate CoA-transferase